MTTPGQYAQELSQRVTGPHDDQTTTQTAGLAAEAIRYLNYAAAYGGITEPATIYTVTGELSTAAYRLPQLLTRISDWLTAETRAGRITSDQHAQSQTDDTCALYGEAAGHAANLAVALSRAHSLTATVRVTQCANPAG